MDPVTLGLCSQIDLDFEVQRAAKDRPVVETEAGATLLPAEITTARHEEHEPAAEKEGQELDVQAVLAKLKQIGGKGQEEEGEE
jgi:uncharacterized protein